MGINPLVPVLLPLPSFSILLFLLRFLDLLKNDGMIDIKTNHLTTIITICNYTSFQLNEPTGEPPHEPTGEPPHEPQYKNDKKEKNDLLNTQSDSQISLSVKKEKTEYDKNDLISIGIDEAIARDFLITRKAKKAKLTETAFAGIVREAEKANLTIQQALQICVERNWQSFKAEWVKDKQSGQYITFYELATGQKPEFKL